MIAVPPRVMVDAGPGEVPDLSVSGLGKDYRSATGNVQALAGVDFALRFGEFVTIIGPSGCGKSTLLKMILGVVSTTTGTIQRRGRVTHGPQVDVGMVFQSPALLPWRTVLDNVLLPIEVLRQPRARHIDAAVRLLTLVGLDEFQHKYPAELSGGMQQRVAICRALIHDPTLMLMDEPFGALDALTRERMQSEMLRMWDETNKTVLLVTHSIDEAIVLSDRVLVMSPRPGRILQEIPIELARPRVAEMRTTADYQQYALTLRRGLDLVSS